MMKWVNYFGAVSMAFAIGGTVGAQTFLKVIGDPGRAESGTVTHLAATGEIYIAGSVNDSALVQRIDGTGAVIWSRAFRPEGQWPKTVVHLSDAPDGSLIGCGMGYSATAEEVEGFHFRMDAAGNMFWLRSWDDPNIVERRILATSAAEYLVFAGVNDPFPPNYTDVLNVRIDAGTGDVIAMTDRMDLFAASPYTDNVRAAVALNGKYYGTNAMSVAGAFISGRRVGLSTYDINGQPLDHKYLVFPDNVDRMVYPTDMVVKDDSLTIAYYGDINGSSDNWTLGLIRCDTLGNIAWARDLNIGGSGQEHGTRLLATSTGYVLAGRTFATTPRKLFLIALSDAGVTQWCRSYGSPVQPQSLTDMYAYNVEDMGDGYLLTGMVDQAGELDMLLIRTDLDGQIDCDQVTDRNSITTVLPTFNYPTVAQYAPLPATANISAAVVEDAGIEDICVIDVALGNDTALCATITLDAGNPGATYEWQDGSTGQTLEVTETGEYWVLVSVGCCVGSDTIQVDIGSLASLDLGPDTTICAGSALWLEPTLGPWTYLWSDNSTDPALLVGDEGTYWVEASDGPCSARDSIVVSLLYQPTVNLGPDTSSCDGTGILLEPVTTDVETYLWSDGTDESTLQVDGTSTITLDVANACGTATDGIVVSIVDAGTLDLGEDTTLCSGSTLELAPDLPGWTFAWSDGSSAALLSVSVEDTYWLDATNAGCTLTDTIEVNVISIPAPDLGLDTIVCSAGPLVLAPALIDVDEVEWSDGSIGNTLSVTTSGTWSITATNACGSGDDEIEVTLVPIDALDLGEDTVLCGTATLLLDLSSSGATLTWQDGSEDDSFLVSEAGTFWVDGDLQGCTVTDTIEVDYSQLPVLDLGPDTVSCEVPFYELDAGVDGDDAVWSNGSEGRYLTVTRSDVYWASITNYCGEVIDSVEVTFAMPVGELEDVALCPGNKVVLDPPGELLEAYWSTGDTALSITVGEGEYSYEAIDIVGCPHEDDVRIFINEGLDGQIYIPNAFSPNNDGFNELFLVEGAERSDFELAVHDRWGEELFRTIDPYQGWDGETATRGGVYVYTITFRDRCAASNTLVTRRGHVTVLR